MTNPEPKTAAGKIADEIVETVNRCNPGLEGISKDWIEQTIAQAIEEATEQGRSERLENFNRVAKTALDSTVEASVLAGALDKALEWWNPGPLEDKHLQVKTELRQIQGDVSPATQAAMGVLEASAEYERRLREFPDDKVLLANAEARWLTAVTEYERVTAGPWQHR